jgi:uncharacterized protein (DUF302 family)
VPLDHRPDPSLIEIAATGSVDDTVARLRGEADGRGLTVFAVIDHAAGARAAGLELRDEVLVILGAAKAGTPVMQAAPRAGLDLPLRVLVWDDGGTTRLTYRDPRALAATHDIDAIDDVLTALQAGLDRLVTAAAG